LLAASAAVVRSLRSVAWHAVELALVVTALLAGTRLASAPRGIPLLLVVHAGKAAIARPAARVGRPLSSALRVAGSGELPLIVALLLT
jgi:hypothetical protein